MNNKKYVFNGKEVIMTGRTAIKKLRSGREDILYEVKLLENVDISSTKYNEWVKMSELYEVVE